MKIVLDFISVDERLPEVDVTISNPLLFIADDRIYSGHYHVNGCFYSGNLVARTKASDKKYPAENLPSTIAKYWIYQECVL